MSSSPAASSSELEALPRDLPALVAHQESISADAPLEELQLRFARSPRDFIAVTDGDRVLGLCARRDIGTLLGARFGFALNSRNPVRRHMTRSPIILRHGTPITDAIQYTVARSPDEFFDDVVLVDAGDRLLGLISMHTLVRVQDDLLREKIGQLQASEEEIRGRNRELERDLHLARNLQVAMLPRETPFGDQLHVGFRYLPNGGVSGDGLELVRLASGRPAVFVCDVMGHGVRAALVSAMVRTLIQNVAAIEADPAAAVTRLNRQLSAMLRQSSDFVFVTSVLLCFDASSQRLEYVQAGHPTPLLCRVGAEAVDRLPISADQEGPALGFDEEFTYRAAQIALRPGDRILAFTDGLIEAEEGGGPFGIERTRAVLARTVQLPLDEALEALIAEARRHAANLFTDDVCVVAIDIPPAQPRASGQPSLPGD